MYVQKLDKNNLQIILTSRDLLQNSMSFYDFMSCPNILLNSIQHIIKDNCKLNLVCFNVTEIFFIPSIKSFVMNVTRLNKKINISKKYKKLNMNTNIFLKFNLLQDLCAFCTDLNLKCTSSLYYLDNSYYLYLNIKVIFEYKKILLLLKEFSNDLKLKNFINKNANLIVKNNAIEICKSII